MFGREAFEFRKYAIADDYIFAHGYMSIAFAGPTRYSGASGH